jgi:hypothetical protein
MVEERGLADVGAADDGDERSFFHLEVTGFLFELRSTGRARAPVPTRPVLILVSQLL